uniref:Uncharacterized protein n=1 Tax=Anopheles braziliensis TaxID=58242 RepID=A0A2M3ZLD0_9DIPT
MLVLFSCVVIAIMLYYRRRVANLRAEVNHVVNYMTQEQPSHFDNPVYSRTTATSGPMVANGSAIPPLDARTGLLRTMIPNNIFPSLASNGRRQAAAAPSHDKYSYPDNNEYGTGQSYSIQYHPDNDLKNLEADLTNPNYYKDHVYDEIGLKDTMDTEYDHLDYSRAGSSHKAHYFRMTDDSMMAAPPGSSPSIPSNIAPHDGSPKPINGVINNLSAPRHGYLNQTPTTSALPIITTTANATSSSSANNNDLHSSSSNSSPTPPSSPPGLAYNRAHHDRDSNSSTLTTTTLQCDDGAEPNADGTTAGLYVPMMVASGRATAAGSEDQQFVPGTSGTGSKIPDHQLNIKE